MTIFIFIDTIFSQKRLSGHQLSTQHMCTYAFGMHCHLLAFAKVVHGLTCSKYMIGVLEM